MLGSSKYPLSVTASFNGTGVDLLQGDGRCFAIQHIGVMGATSWAGTIEESADNVTFTAITGAAFTLVTAASSLQIITFDRTKRYVRYVGTIGGAGTVLVSAFIGEQYKQVPA